MTLRLVLLYKRLLDAGGAERLVLEEMEHLRRFGHDARLLTWRTRPPALFGRSPVPGAELVEVGDGGAALARAAAWLRRFRPHWILSSSGHIDAWLLARASGTPYSLHVHHPLFLSLGDRDKYARRYRHAFEELCRENPAASHFRAVRAGLGPLERLRLEARAALHHRAVAGARHVLVLSERAREEKRRLYGVEAHVLRGGLARAEPRDGEQGPARRALGVPAGGPLVFTVARLVEGKRVALLIEALALLRERQPGATLAVGGTGPEEGRLREAAARCGLAGQVSFLGGLDEEALALWYRAADVFASLEGADFLLTPLEALAAGTPAVVSTETDLGAELPATGWLLPTPPEPARAARALAEAWSRRGRLDHRRLAAALQPFLWERYFRGVEALLLEGAARGRARPPGAKTRPPQPSGILPP